MKNRTKKQHYIAQCLLKIFVDNGNIYECITDNKQIYKTSFRNSMCQNNVYESNFFIDNHLENFFANYIDGATAIINRKIITKLNEEKCNLENVYKDFISNLHLYIVNYYKSITSLIRFSAKEMESEDFSIITMLSRILNKDYIKRLCMIFKKCYKFSVIKSIEGNFILCDQYLATCSMKYKGMFTNISSRDIGVKDTMIFIPLNHYYYFVFYDNDTDELKLSEDKINCLDEEQVRKINNVIYSNAYKKVVSSNAENIKLLEKQNTSLGDATAMMVYKDGHSVSHRVKSEIFLTNEQVEFYKYYKKLTWGKPIYKKYPVNSKCPCGSDKKYKKCCKNEVDECWRIFNNQRLNRDILINTKLGMEEPVRMPNNTGKEIIEMVERERKKI